jgi:hypothetical protein
MIMWVATSLPIGGSQYLLEFRQDMPTGRCDLIWRRPG